MQIEGYQPPDPPQHHNDHERDYYNCHDANGTDNDKQSINKGNSDDCKRQKPTETASVTAILVVSTKT